MGSIFGGGDPYQQQTITAPYPTFDNNANAPYGTGDYAGGSDTGGSGGGILDWLGSEKGQRALQQLGGFSSGMLAGSAPSLTPRNFSTGLGAGMAGLQQAGSQYYTDALRRAQAQEAQVKIDNERIWNATLQREANNATGLPPGYMPGSGTSTPAVANPPATGGFAQYAPLIQKYESASKPYVGYGGTDLSKAPLSDTGFPIWGGRMGPAGNSTAAGLYQITGSTWDPIARQLGIKDFSPESQYKVAEALYAQRGLDPWLPYNKNLSAAIGRGEAPNPFGQAPPIGANVANGAPATASLPPSIRPPSAVDPAPPVGGLAARFPGVAAARPGLLSGAPPSPVVTIPPVSIPQAAVAAPAMRQASATTPDEPAATTGSSAPPAARVAVAGTPTLTEGDSIAYGFQKFGGLPGNPKGGRNPEQVLQNIDSNLKRDPDYYRGKTVILSSGVMNGPGRIDLVPEQIQRIQDSGGKVILAGVDTGKFAGHNSTLAQMAAEAGVPFAGPLPTNDVHPGPDGYRQYLARVQRGAARLTGGGPGTVSTGAGQPDKSDNAPAPVVGAAAAPAPAPSATQPAPSPPPPITAGPMSTPVAVPAARPGGPMSLPGGVPYGAPLPAAPPPGATTAPGGPPPPPVPGAAAAPASAMPGAIAPPPVAAPPPPVAAPNLGQVQPPGAGGIPPYDVEAARRAQMLSIAGAATGHQVPAYLAEQAGLPNKAVEQQWALQKELYTHQLQAAQSQWNAASELQKQQIAAQQGLQKSQYESELRVREEMLKQGHMIGPDGRVMVQPGFPEAEGQKAGAVAGAQQEAQRQRELDTPKEYNITDPVTNTPSTIIRTPRQMQAATNQPGMTPGYQSGANPAVTARIELHKTAAGEARQVAATGQRLAPVLDEIIRIADKTPQGMAGPIGAALAAKLSGLGFPVSESLTNAELMRSLSQQLIPTVRQPGAQSNAEMAVYSLAVPGLQQSAIGRQQIANLNRAMIGRANEIANLREDNIGAADLNEKLTALHNKPLFTDGQRAVMQAATGRSIDKATYDLLPPGMDYTDPKGVKRTKPAAVQ